MVQGPTYETIDPLYRKIDTFYFYFENFVKGIKINLKKGQNSFMPHCLIIWEYLMCKQLCLDGIQLTEEKIRFKLSFFVMLNLATLVTT